MQAGGYGERAVIRFKRGWPGGAARVARLIVRGLKSTEYYYFLASFGSPAVQLSSPPFNRHLLRVFAPSPTLAALSLARLGTPGPRSFRPCNNSRSRGFSACRALVIMRGEPCISHRGIIRECFPCSFSFFPPPFFPLRSLSLSLSRAVPVSPHTLFFSSLLFACAVNQRDPERECSGI